MISLKRYMNKLLLSAIDQNNEEKIIELVNKGADVNAKDKQGYSILMLASYSGSAELIKFLIAKGADVNYIQYDDCYDLYENVVQYAYYAHAEGRDFDVIKLLLEKMDINLQNKNGETLLMWAAKRGYVDMLKLILQRGASLDITDKIGWNALEWASWSGELEVVGILRKAGAGWICIFRGN